jgi:SSS family solute:Na+ symporter|tara:strand:- start:452 stop:1819 length:1368 start_codon:yes stop_codon:yes gene_type:complete
MHWLDLLVLGFYLLCILFLGFYRTNNKNEPDEYILAGRRLSLPSFVITLTATWYGGILGIGENTYLFGLQTWFVFGLPYYLFALIFAFFIAGKINRLNSTSIPDQFHSRYGKTAGIISALYILVLSSPAPYILSVGVLLQFSLGLPFSFSLLLSTTISLCYIWFGGFRSIIRTDFIQIVFMFLGFILLLYYCIKYSSINSISLNTLPKSHLDFTGGASIQYILAWFFIALWTFVDPGFYQRCAAAKSAKTAKNGILIAICFWFIFDILTLSTGMYAKVLLTNGDPLFSYPRLGALVLPPLVYGIFITGLLATIMSTIDSLGFISAITFGRDILWRIRSQKGMNSKEWDMTSTNFIREGLIVTALIALSLAFIIPSVVKLWYILGSILIPGLILPFLISFSSMKITILPMMIIPILVSSIWIIIGQIVGNYPLELEPFYPGMLTSIIIYGINRTNG